MVEYVEANSFTTTALGIVPILLKLKLRSHNLSRYLIGNWGAFAHKSCCCHVRSSFLGKSPGSKSSSITCDILLIILALFPLPSTCSERQCFLLQGPLPAQQSGGLQHSQDQHSEAPSSHPSTSRQLCAFNPFGVMHQVALSTKRRSQAGYWIC